jgi:nucleotide-binding universal stress UspA family protein
MNMDHLHAIVVATDFSEAAERAMRRAAAIADERGLPLELVHVVSAGRIAADARRSLDAATASLDAPGRRVRARLVVGDVPTEIIAASAPGVLVVVGARATPTWGDLFLGSTAGRVVRDSKGPVLVVREEAGAPYREVVVGVDLDRGSSTLLGHVAGFVPGARLTVLHAYDVPFEGALSRAGVQAADLERHRGVTLHAALEAVGSLAREAAGNASRWIPAAGRGDPARLLVEHARRSGADLLAVAKRSRSALAALLMGSVARRVVTESGSDVLVLPAPAAS